MATLHFTAVIKEILEPEVDASLQKPYVNNYYLVEEYNGGQYPERAILSVYDKDGQGSCWNKILEELGHFPQPATMTTPGEPFELYFHLDATCGTSQKTGKAYKIQKELKAWKFGKPEEKKEVVKPAAGAPCAYKIPGFNDNAPQQPSAFSPQNNVQSQQQYAQQQQQFVQQPIPGQFVQGGNYNPSSAPF